MYHDAFLGKLILRGNSFESPTLGRDWNKGKRGEARGGEAWEVEEEARSGVVVMGVGGRGTGKANPPKAKRSPPPHPTVAWGCRHLSEDRPGEGNPKDPP